MSRLLICDSRSHFTAFTAWTLVTCCIVAAARSTDASEPATASTDFFENNIRPVLVRHCYECHSADSDDVGGGLLLDSSAGMTTGGDSGPAIDPGNGAASLLVSALRYEATEMPPDGKLPDHVIANFVKWIDDGAVDPRVGKTNPQPRPPTIDIEKGRQFWAFRPLISQSPGQSYLPPPQDSDSPTIIDRYLNLALGEAGLSPVDEASPETQLRRLSFDLTGLPPSVELQNQWLADPSPRHWTRIVDRLLASPEFGQHWARHWMDIARYADSNGSDFNATYHEAYRYRDYLIDAFNSDKPFDAMIHQQIAGDLLPASSDAQREENLVASTFLMLGPKMLSERDKAKLELDVVDDQIDTIGRAFLGLTLGCARCHDHKFDPIPTRDYYALAGIFRSTVTLKGESQEYVSTWNRQPLPVSESHLAAKQSHQAKLDSINDQIKPIRDQLKRLRQDSLRSLGGVVVDDTDATKQGKWTTSTYSKPFIGEGYVHDNNNRKGKSSIRFAADLPSDGDYEVRVSYTHGDNRARRVPVTIKASDKSHQVELDQRSIEHPPMWSTLGTFAFKSNQPAIVTIRNESTDGYVIADAVLFRLIGQDEPQDEAPVEDHSVAIAELETKLKHAEAKKKDLLKNAPSDPIAMAPSDRPSEGIADSPIHIRGEINNVGEVVPRGFLSVCGTGESTIEAPNGSGRLELADWLTDPQHPLVSRVFVNRVWMHLMGQGIVRTVDNFGVMGERPTHPELLDYLADDFMEGGWRVKRLIHAIVHTSAYRRASTLNDDNLSLDPENRLLWRMHRRRLPAEAIRDSMLVISGQANFQSFSNPMKNHGVLVSGNNAKDTVAIDEVSSPLRSVFLPTVRGYLPAMMTALDVADPDLLVGRRPTTNVPGQALMLINSPEIDTWAEQAAERITRERSTVDSRTTLVYQTCLQRMPTEDDRALIRSFLAASHRDDSDHSVIAQSAIPQSAVAQWKPIIAAIFASTEFRLLD